MNSITPSQAVAAHLMSALNRLGVEHVFISPGTRSQALVIAASQLEKAGMLTTHVRVDERSAAFHALGVALATKRPVAMITTSGSAVANLHPAIVEAHHAGVPLIALTADRPMELRNVGANQTTNQIGIFADAVRTCIALEAPPLDTAQAFAEDAALRAVTAALGVRTLKPGPVQINVAFRDPLSSSEPNAAMVESKVALPQGWPAEEPNIAQIQAASQTIILAGAGSGKAAAELAELAGWPLLAEPSSGARFGKNAIVNYRLLLQQKTQLVNDVKRVIVFGKPTLNRLAISILFRTDVEITVVRNIDYGFFDVSKRALRFVDSVEPLGEPMVGWLDAWKDASREVAVSKPTEGINRHIVIQAVWGATDSKDSLLLGASRLIRDAENWAPRKEVQVYSNRGLAGIDGTIATAAGISIGQNSDATTRVLLGDLAFLHDVGSLVADETEPN
ncbi:MAG: 2-succinyl-5-enolpyruvyl-6-hydroxy-3-cyclohexene-1-carboxylic-acid synthase, partial [Actinomycetes bacterium]